MSADDLWCAALAAHERGDRATCEHWSRLYVDRIMGEVPDVVS